MTDNALLPDGSVTSSYESFEEQLGLVPFDNDLEDDLIWFTNEDEEADILFSRHDSKHRTNVSLDEDINKVLPTEDTLEIEIEELKKKANEKKVVDDKAKEKAKEKEKVEVKVDKKDKKKDKVEKKVIVKTQNDTNKVRIESVENESETLPEHNRGWVSLFVAVLIIAVIVLIIVIIIKKDDYRLV